MNKTVVIMAMSGCGKDLAINYMSNKYDTPISISNTTRPIRKGERQGVEYNFMSKQEFDKYEYPIPPRIYYTKFGDWYYGTSLNVKGKLVILDLEGTKALCEYLGRENVEVIKINTNQIVLLKRLLKRGDNKFEIKRRLKDDLLKFKDSDCFADYIIENNGTLQGFYNKLDFIMRGLD